MPAADVVLVTPRDSYRTGAFLDAARDLDCRVTVVTDAEVALPGAAVVVDLGDPVAAADTVERHLRRPPDAVVGTDGAAPVAAAVLAERFDLVASPPDAVRTAMSKSAQRRALDERGVGQPRWGVVGPDGSWPDLGPGPLVVKPDARSGGQGVERVDTARAAIGAVERVRDLVGPAEDVLVERYVGGREVAVDALVVGGRVRPIAVFDKPDAGGGPFFAETLLVRPGRLSAAERAAVADLVDRAVDAVGLVDGPVHVEARVGGDGAVRFLELAPRSIGGLCARMLRPAGVALERVLLTAALGRPLPAALDAEGPASGVYMIPVPRPGVLEEVGGVEAAGAIPGITGVELSVGPGTTVVPVPEAGGYVGFVFAEGDGPDDVEASLRSAARELVVSVSSSGGTGRCRRRDR